MSQKKNSDREFLVDLWSDDEDYLDFGTDDEIDHNTSLTDLLDRDDRRREETQLREREEREARRSQTVENTISNSGDFILYLFSFMLVFLLYIFLSIAVASPQLPISKVKCLGVNCTTIFEPTIRTEYLEFKVVDGKNKCYNSITRNCRLQGSFGKKNNGVTLVLIGLVAPRERRCLSRGQLLFYLIRLL